MTNEEIKTECEMAYLQIKQAEELLVDLRKECKHKKTYEGHYSYRIGHIQMAEICEYCGEFIKYIES